ncbi:MAG: glycosyltransferase [Pseudomonas sp.]
MSILNIMWSGGSAYLSTHKVHREILGFIQEQESVRSWLLLPGESSVLEGVGSVESFGLSSRRLKGSGWRLGQRFIDHLRLRRRLLRASPRLVILDGIGVARYLLPILKKMKCVRVMVIFHGTKSMRPVEIRRLREFPAERLYLIAVSKTLAEDVSRQAGLPVLGARSALEPAPFRNQLLTRDAARAALGLSGDVSRVLGAVGRLVPEKGFVHLLKAVVSTLQADAGLHLVIVGEGLMRAELEGLILLHGLQAQVHLPGHVADAVALYRAFDLVCIPSEQEGLGLVLQEAVIAGVPVLVSDLPVFREQLDGVDGFVAATNADAWSIAITQFLQGKCESLASRQYERLAPECAWTEFKNLYRGLLNLR